MTFFCFFFVCLATLMKTFFVCLFDLLFFFFDYFRICFRRLSSTSRWRGAVSAGEHDELHVATDVFGGNGTTTAGTATTDNRDLRQTVTVQSELLTARVTLVRLVEFMITNDGINKRRRQEVIYHFFFVFLIFFLRYEEIANRL